MEAKIGSLFSFKEVRYKSKGNNFYTKGGHTMITLILISIIIFSVVFGIVFSLLGFLLILPIGIILLTILSMILIFRVLYDIIFPSKKNKVKAGDIHENNRTHTSRYYF